MEQYNVFSYQGKNGLVLVDKPSGDTYWMNWEIGSRGGIPNDYDGGEGFLPIVYYVENNGEYLLGFADTFNLKNIVGVEKLVNYIDDPANNIDKDAFTLYGGHSWQKGNLEKLGSQYVYDMWTLIQKIGEGTAERSPMTGGRGAMNTNFKYGTATICWSDTGADEYSKEYLMRRGVK